jgi:hypothetical protein
VAPSYRSFEALAEGRLVDWSAPRPVVSSADAGALLAAATELAGCAPNLVVADIPLSHRPITGRRAADRTVSRAYGGRGCGTHSPGDMRPGPLGVALRDGFGSCGYSLVRVTGARSRR